MRFRSYILHIAACLIFVGVACFVPLARLQETCLPEPEPESSVPAPAPAPQPLKLLFSGDVMQHTSQVNAARTDNGFDYSPVFRSVSRLWKEADFTIVNLETTISPDGRYAGYPCFSSPAELIYALKDAGVDVAVLANNHCVDRGEKGVRATLHHMDSIGIAHTGVRIKSDSSQSVLILNHGDYRIALLNYTYDTNGIPVPSAVEVNHIDTISIRRDIEEAVGRESTHIIAFFHWGLEYMRKPDKAQKKLVAWCKENGVNIVIGSHSHMVQPIDTALQVAYSLGNLVSNQRDRYKDGGISVKITLNPDGSVQMEYVPHWVDANGPDRYRILLPEDTVFCQDKAFLRSLDDSRDATAL